jgi:hypothetical protein
MVVCKRVDYCLHFTCRFDFCPTNRSFEVICRVILDRDTCVACMPGLAA